MNRSPSTHSMWLALIPFLLGLGMGGKNLVRNGDFERFTGGEPVGWETTNIPNMLAVVSQSTDSHSGKYAVRCEVKDFHGTKMAGMLCLKDVSVSGTSLQMKGFYVLHPVGNDVGFVSVSFKNESSAAIGSMEEVLSKGAEKYLPFSRETKIPETATKMDVHLTLLAGKGNDNVHEGSYMLPSMRSTSWSIWPRGRSRPGRATCCATA